MNVNNKEVNARQIKRGESLEHRLLKVISTRALEAEGYNVKNEERIGNSTIDVLGKNGNHVVIIECEAFRTCQKKNLKMRFKEALFSFPRLKRVLCIPKFVEFDEIWAVDIDSGILTRYDTNKIVEAGV